MIDDRFAYEIIEGDASYVEAHLNDKKRRGRISRRTDGRDEITLAVGPDGKIVALVLVLTEEYFAQLGRAHSTAAVDWDKTEPGGWLREFGNVDGALP